jgi:thymidylate synthase
MRHYLNLLEHCLRTGVRQKNRTGVDTIMIPGGMMQFDLSEGFPVLTTKRIAFASVVGETIGFIRGYNNAEQFRKLKCMYWDANANVNKTWLGNPYRKGPDDLGRIYGVQWRHWGGSSREGDVGFDQLAKLLQTIDKDPTSRRMVVTAWNPVELHLMALPPCHLMFQVLIAQEARKMHMCMTMRSADMFLGVPMNITSYALLLSLLAMVTGYDPGKLTIFLADLHIYENHVGQVLEQLARTPKSLPQLEIEEEILGFIKEKVSPLRILEAIEPYHVRLRGYESHPPIKAEMAV